MADFSGIAAFGEGAVGGYDKALSNYARIAEIARQREAARRAEQAQQLQTLIHGTSLAQTSPDVAEMAAREPERYGLSPETVGPGVTQARAQQAAMARLNRALSSGDLDSIMNDPEAARFITEKHLPIIKEMQDRKKVDAIMAGPGTPQEKAQALVRAGVKVDSGMFESGFPELGGAKSEQQALGTARGQLPLAESLAQAKAVGQGRGELVTAGPLSQARKTGEITAELSPDITPAGVPLGGTNVGRIARERETEADRARKLRGPAERGTTPADLSVVLNRNRTQARQEVEQHIKNTAPVFKTLPPMDQQIILDYYTVVRQNSMLSQDPGWEGRPLPVVPPKPDAVTKFEAEGQPGPGFFSGLYTYLMGESTGTAPRTLRTPASPAAGGWGKAEVVR